MDYISKDRLTSLREKYEFVMSYGFDPKGRPIRLLGESHEKPGHLRTGPLLIVTDDTLHKNEEQDFAWKRGNGVSLPFSNDIAKFYNDRELSPIWEELQEHRREIERLSPIDPEAQPHVIYHNQRVRLLQSVVSEFAAWYRKCGFELPIGRATVVRKESKGHRRAQKIYDSGALNGDAQNISDLIRDAKARLKEDEADFNVRSYRKSLKRAGFYPTDVEGASKAERDEQKFKTCCKRIRKFAEEGIFPTLDEASES